MRLYRWFAMAALLLGTTGLYADEEAAAQALQRIDGAVIVPSQPKPGEPVTQVILNVTKVTDEDLKHLKEFPRLHTLGCSATKRRQRPDRRCDSP